MSWDHQQYVDFIKKHAPAADLGSLLQANSKPFISKHAPNRGTPAKLFVTYYSMPDWLDIFSSQPKSLASPQVRLDSRLGKVPFGQIIGEYRHAAQQHQDKVTACLNRIDSLPSGQALVAELGATRHSIRVMPYWHYFRTLPGADYFSSRPIPVRPGESMSYIADGTARAPNDAYEKSAPIRDENSEPMPDEGKGTGKGTNVVLFFSAETWKTAAAPKGPGFKSDEVLFHELVHITRMIRGRLTLEKVEGKGGYGNIEEYFATVISNVYLSDKGEADLRGFYSNDFMRENRTRVKIDDEEILVVTDPLPKDWSVMKDPGKFYDNVDNLSIPPRQLMQMFKDKQSDFYFALAHLPETKPRFNPVGQHFRESLRPSTPAVPARKRP